LIFVTVGTQRFPFNRLLTIIDRLIEKEVIVDDVIAQIGYSDYKPKNFAFFKFCDQSKLDELTKDCKLLITHAGVGTITKALEYGKKIVVIPRREDLNEHIDNHQLEIAQKFEEDNFLKFANNEEELEDILTNINEIIFNKYIAKELVILDSIRRYIEGINTEKRKSI